jgi:hypothetical protein
VLSVSSLYNYCYDTSYKLCQSSFKILYPFLLTPTIRSFEMLSHDRMVILLWLESYFRRIDNQCGFVSSPRLTVFNPPWVEKRGVSSLLNIDCTYVTTIHLNPIKLSWVCWSRWKLGFDMGKVKGGKAGNLSHLSPSKSGARVGQLWSPSSKFKPISFLDEFVG